ncbi:MAG: hypothetical protein NVSMB1_13890 [Polyangiales bacterium]
MNDPKKTPAETPQRTSQPHPPSPPMEAPPMPQTEYERSVPHGGEAPIAHKKGASGEGSYEATEQYNKGLKNFSKQHSVDESVREGKLINPNDADLKKAEEIGKAGGQKTTGAASSKTGG